VPSKNKVDEVFGNKNEEKIWKAKSYDIDMLIRGEDILCQPQRIEGEIILPRVLVCVSTSNYVKRYAELDWN
jgi:hypothetical protein